MNYIRLGILLSEIVVLVFGIFGCDKEKVSRNAPPDGLAKSSSPEIGPGAEIKLKIPTVISKDTEEMLLTEAAVSAKGLSPLDKINFNQFSIRTSNHPVDLEWITDCQDGATTLIQRGSHEISQPIQLSELLPVDLFFSSSARPFALIKCKMSFTARQKKTAAQHEFSFEITLNDTPDKPLKYLHTANKVEVGSGANIDVIQVPDLPNYSLLESAGQNLFLYCDKFISPLTLIKEVFSSVKIEEPLWVDRTVESKFPLQEYPHQVCRILAKKNGNVFGWTAYFELRSPVQGPHLQWSPVNPGQNYPMNVAERAHALTYGTLVLTNNQPYSVTAQIPKGISLNLVPFCTRNMWGLLHQRSQAEITNPNGSQILVDSPEYWTLRIPGGKNLVITYKFNTRFTCACPYQEPDNGRANWWEKMEIGFFVSTNETENPSIKLLSTKGNYSLLSEVVSQLAFGKLPQSVWVPVNAEVPKGYLKRIQEKPLNFQYERNICH